MSAPADWTALKLAGHGRSLVEASAGTGKTWTIGMVYLRLLLEQRRSPRRIIVSTFTNAAAAELAERLRARLLWALAEATRHAAGDGVVADRDEASDRAWLRNRWRADASALSADTQLLQAALGELDAAPVFTLHALCARVLVDHPFVASALFHGREMIDGRTLETALVADLWRVVAQGEASDPLVELARHAQMTRARLRKYVPVLAQPNVTVAGASPEALVAATEDIVGSRADFAGKLRSVLDEPGLLSANGRTRKAWSALADALASSAELGQAIADHHDTLRDAIQLMKGVNKSGKEHPAVLQLVEQSALIANSLPLLADLASNLPLRRFLAAAQRWCRDSMQSRLDALNQSTFDQLLHAVHAALEPRDGQRALADALYAAWPVALVDEFQDTDPVQFGILDAIYRAADREPRGRLLMIGDPKQAIYRFRGGDVQAYERAKGAVPPEDCLTLDVNHRSSRGYVNAINAFYAVTGTRLGPEDSETTITYERVQASGRRDGAPLRSARSGKPITRPLVLHEQRESSSAPMLEADALRACAGQIVWALSDEGYCIGEDPLKPGDIAVLLPSHVQIARLAAMLKTRGVPCVTVSQTSVFDTDTARDLRLLLHAVLHADDPRTMRAALVTRVWGRSLGDLQALRHDAAAWDAEAARVHALQAVLATQGPLAVVIRLLKQHAARLLATVEGERMLTDLRHLGELLQEAWEERGGGERLMAWFADQMDGGDGTETAADARALRLESEAGRVKLMTLHVSKGLEFGVVFLPLMWKHTRPLPARNGAQWLADHDGRNKYLVEDPARALVQQQEFEERYRMLYVALTRAIHACHVFTLSPEVRDEQKQLDDAPLNALDLSGLWSAGSAASASVAHHVGWETHGELQWSAPAAGSAARVARALPPAPRGPLPMRHSFTTLSGGGGSRVAEADAAADDEGVESTSPEAALDAAEVEATPPTCTFHAELDHLSTVAGTDFGNAVHSIFEKRVAGVSLLAQPARVRAALDEFGVRARDGDTDALGKALAVRLQGVLEARLGGDDGPSLFDLSAEDMRAEMEFNYLLGGASLRALRETCEANGEHGLVPAREQALAGLMNGKIDLLFAHGGRFHVLDYKGNQLARGARACLEDYAPEALEEKMNHTGYRFQALLYTIAVERYLRERLGTRYLRTQHLGDCWYLFIRAAGLHLPDGTPCGVWRHRFSDALLDGVQDVLGSSLREVA
ncbi:UvrD-helicase domain-containing protein [Dokdonella sp.]|uniref:UvrD-helicase domain-containing protein n=1 Tax=Dokdonella sp. TaxID=2291710 RepID=UPI003784FAB8